jgi:hypothetical protein
LRRRGARWLRSPVTRLLPRRSPDGTGIVPRGTPHGRTCNRRSSWGAFPFSDLSGTRLHGDRLGRPWRDCDHIRRFCRWKSAPGQLCATGQALYRKSRTGFDPITILRPHCGHWPGGKAQAEGLRYKLSADGPASRPAGRVLRIAGRGERAPRRAPGRRLVWRKSFGRNWS